jgi:hypothetical protein
VWGKAAIEGRMLFRVCANDVSSIKFTLIALWYDDVYLITMGKAETSINRYDNITKMKTINITPKSNAIQAVKFR